MKLVGKVVGLALTSAALTAASQLSLGASTREVAPTREELASWSEALASDDRAARTAAVSSLLALEADALPAIEARLHALGVAGVEGKSLQLKLQRLKRGVAVLPAARADMSRVLRNALDADRSPAMRRAVEIVALLRSLEAQRSTSASEVIVGSLFALEPRVLRPEAARARRRLGALLIPAYLRHRTHPNPALQRLSRDGLVALGVTSLDRAFAQHRASVLAGVIAAQGSSLRAESLPWLVSYLDDDRPAVREAAQRATLRYGSQAVPLLQQRFADALNAEPEPTWDSEHLVRELQVRRSALTAAPLRAQLDGAEAALAAGDLDKAEQTLAEVLQARPEGELALRTSTAYAALAARHDSANRPERALALYRRALRADPDGPLAKQMHASILYLQTERRLSCGIVDLNGLSQAITLDPSLRPAHALLDELGGGRRGREEGRRRRLGQLAAILLAVSAFLVLRTRALTATVANDLPASPARARTRRTSG